MAYIDDLKTARDNMAARLKDVTAAPKPSYDVDGQKVSWTEYIRLLAEGVERLNAVIDDKDDTDGGPYSEEIQAYTEPPFGAIPGGGLGV